MSWRDSETFAETNIKHTILQFWAILGQHHFVCLGGGVFGVGRNKGPYGSTCNGGGCGGGGCTGVAVVVVVAIVVAAAAQWQ